MGELFNKENIRKLLKSLSECFLSYKAFNRFARFYEIEDYNYTDSIEYIIKMHGYRDAGRIIVFGIDRLIKHIDYMAIDLKGRINSIHINSEYRKRILDLFDSLLFFSRKYMYEFSSNSIGHIGWNDNERFLYEGNAYKFENKNSIHIYIKFDEYLLNMFEEYLKIKIEILDILYSMSLRYNIEIENTDIINVEINELDKVIIGLKESLEEIKKIDKMDISFEEKKEIIKKMAETKDGYTKIFILDASNIEREY